MDPDTAVQVMVRVVVVGVVNCKLDNIGNSPTEISLHAIFMVSNTNRSHKLTILNIN